MTREQKEIEQLRVALDYERRQRYAAEAAANNTHEVGRSVRPERNAYEEWEHESCPR